MPLYDSILQTIGRTPIVRLNRVAPDHVTLYAKVESFNPGGSVKDRLALAVVLDAERKGLLKPGDTICECTSGNVGIALAMVSAARGYNFVAVMSDSYSVRIPANVTGHYGDRDRFAHGLHAGESFVR